MRTTTSCFTLVLLFVGATLASASGCAIGKSSNPLWDPMGLTAWARKGNGTDSLASRGAPKPPSIAMNPNRAESFAANSSRGGAVDDHSHGSSNVAGNLPPDYPVTPHGDSAYPTRPVSGTTAGGGSGGYYNDTASLRGSTGGTAGSAYGQAQDGYYSPVMPGGNSSGSGSYPDYTRSAGVPDEYRSGGSYGGASGGSTNSGSRNYDLGTGGSGSYAGSPGATSPYGTQNDPYSRAGTGGGAAGGYDNNDKYSASPYPNTSSGGSSYNGSTPPASGGTTAGSYRPGSTSRSGSVPWEASSTETQPYSSSGVQPARYDQSQPSSYGTGSSGTGGSYGGYSTQPYSSGSAYSGGSTYSSGSSYPSGSSSGAGYDSTYGTSYKQ